MHVACAPRGQRSTLVWGAGRSLQGPAREEDDHGFVLERGGSLPGEVGNCAEIACVRVLEWGRFLCGRAYA